MELLTEFTPSIFPSTINMELLTEFNRPMSSSTINMELLTEFIRCDGALSSFFNYCLRAL